MITSYSKFYIFITLFFSLISTNLYAQQANEPWQGAYTSEAFADGAIRNVYCDLVGLVEGNFGGLLFVVAGIMAITFVAFGDTKNASTMLIVAIGAVTISTGISLYFGDLGCANQSLNNETSRISKIDYSDTDSSDSSSSDSGSSDNGSLF